jgi:hypothetical protein
MLNSVGEKGKPWRTALLISTRFDSLMLNFIKFCFVCKYIYIHYCIIGGDLNLPQVDWKGITEGASVAHAFINRLVWNNGYMKVV